MSRKRKPGKPAAIVLRWNRQVLRHEWRGKTHRTQIIAVASVLIDHADPGGGEIWPSIETIASKAGVNRNTACTALAELRAAGMLTRHGKRFGAINYRLRLVAVSDEILPDDAPSISDSISDSIRRDTQPPTSEQSEEEEEKVPAIGGVNAASAGNTKPPRIEGDEADQIITTFVTAFDTKWADRPRGKTIAVTKLEPSRRQLREALITKHAAGWPIEHLVDRAFDAMPTDERTIRHLTAFVADKIRRLPAEPDHAARVAIHAAQLKTQNTTPTKSRATAVAAVTAELHDTSGQICDIINEIASLNEPDDDERSYRVACQLWSDYRAAEIEHLGNLSTNELDPHEYITTENLDTYGVKVREFYQLHLKALTRRRTSLQRAAQRQAQRSTTK
jgi:DNA-binding transcriptional regulator YhcF (GntR family)